MDNGQIVFRTTSAGFHVVSPEAEQSPDSEFLTHGTPNYAKLKEWASRPENAPPQSWWDDDTDPFAIDE